IRELKSSTGNDIIAYGGGEFISSLIKENLIDEYYFFINPSILGNGMPIFQKTDYKTELKLRNAKAYECGITVVKYTN
ncbi:MAG: dihydrofolate reductase, partial [Croceitalea sp.]|nr:dihydrofolate reductase [Croceitalea sp.]